MNIVSLCTGTGALDRAVQNVFGGELAWYSEFDPHISKIMAHRHPEVENRGDLKTIEWPAPGEIDILTAGYPCTPFSSAGKQLGAADERHLWPYVAKAIGISRPRLVVLENVRNHLRIGFKEVLADLAALGYDCRWSVVRASDVGSCHQRARLFVVAFDTACSGDGGVTGVLPREAGAAGAERPDEGRVGDAALGTGAGQAAAHTEGRGHERLWLGGNESKLAELGDALGADLGPEAAAHAEGERLDGSGEARDGRGGSADSSDVDWGEYGPAVRRWEHVLGRPAPHPTELGVRGNRRLSARFAEWMMGMPDGWVTDVPDLSRTHQIKAIGNGVVQLQAEHALRGMLVETL